MTNPTGDALQAVQVRVNLEEQIARVIDPTAFRLSGNREIVHWARSRAINQAYAICALFDAELDDLRTQLSAAQAGMQRLRDQLGVAQ